MDEELKNATEEVANVEAVELDSVEEEVEVQTAFNETPAEDLIDEEGSVEYVSD